MMIRVITNTEEFTCILNVIVEISDYIESVEARIRTS